MVLVGIETFSLSCRSMAMAFIIFTELWATFFTNVQSSESHFRYVGGFVGHTLSNIGGIMGPNFETEGHASIHN